MPVAPPPDKSDQIAPLPPVNDGLKRPDVKPLEPKLPPVDREPR